MIVDTSNKIPIQYWLKTMPEANAVEQANNVANLPFAYHHVAIMPDVHSGFAMPIGGILAADSAIVPYAIGSDIGCGMCALKTDIRDIDINVLKSIMGDVRKVVPVGVNQHNKKDCTEEEEDILFYAMGDFCSMRFPVTGSQEEKIDRQLGTLGSGNHFLEFQKDNDGFLWIMVHTGSRNLGAKVCDYYYKLAVKMNERWHSSVPKQWQLNFFPIESNEGKMYMQEMQYCVQFAFANRQVIMNRVKNVVSDHVNNCKFDEMINIAHNYARWENHFGRNVIVHRKGATSAKKGEIGIIPGSMGTKSYIVEGLGNRDSFCSCSHGAGRLMGRNEAKKTLNLAHEIDKMDRQGIVHGLRSVNELDEAPGSYKDIYEVMSNQQDLVSIKTELTPIAVIKG